MAESCVQLFCISLYSQFQICIAAEAAGEREVALSKERVHTNLLPFTFTYFTFTSSTFTYFTFTYFHFHFFRFHFIHFHFFPFHFFQFYLQKKKSTPTFFLLAISYKIFLFIIRIFIIMTSITIIVIFIRMIIMSHAYHHISAKGVGKSVVDGQLNG